MTLKIAMLALALAAAWFLLFRSRHRAPAPGAAAPKRKRPPSTAALERCPHCGVYHMPGRPCGCGASSTQGS